MTCGEVALWLGHLHPLAGFRLRCTLGGVDNVIVCPIQRSQLCICVLWVRGLHLYDRNADVIPGCTPVDYCRGRGLLVFYRTASSRYVMRGASFVAALAVTIEAYVVTIKEVLVVPILWRAGHPWYMWPDSPQP